MLNSDTGTDELLDGDAEIARFIFSLHTGSGFVPDPDFHENLIGEFLMKLQIVILGVFSAATFGSIFSGCNGASAVAGGGAASSIVGPVSSVKPDPIKPPSVTRSYSTDVLLFVGAGTSVSRLAVVSLEDHWEMFRQHVQRPPERMLEMIGEINVGRLQEIGWAHDPLVELSVAETGQYDLQVNRSA